MGLSTSEPTPSAEAVRADELLDLSVVIVNYNVRDFLEQSLRSVLRAGAGLEMEIFVVDNNSVDGSLSMVRTQFPDVRLIDNAANVGFGAANNQAMRKARGRHVLILNPDTLVQEDTLATMVRFLDEHPEAGAVGCKILHPDGSFALESRRAFPTPRVAFYRMTGLASLFPKSPSFGRYNMTHLSVEEPAEVDALSGSCMMVRRSAIFGDDARSGAGLFDEDFFMYGEDLDWCYRIQLAGWKIFYTPDTQIIHYKGESTKKGEIRYVRLFYGAMLRFTEKHFESRYSKLFAALLRAGILIRAGVSVLGKYARAFAWPLADFLTVFAAASAVAFVHAQALGAEVAPLFFAVVAPAYAVGAVAGVAAAGGYGYRRRIRSVWIGMFAGLLVVASMSFFVKDIAFSRLVVLLTYPTASMIATALRSSRNRVRRGTSRLGRAVLVGHRSEAVRLNAMLSRHPSPPFDLEGFVTPDADAVRNGDASAAPRLLGRADQLREIVRIHKIKEVVFASATLSNQSIFRYIHHLRDLGPHFRILAEGRDHVIGKASVDDLSMVNLVEADAALTHIRPPAARRAVDLSAAVIGLALHPLLALAAKLAGRRSLPARLAERTRCLPKVLTGRLSLVGYKESDGYRPPEEWSLRPGLFAVSEALEIREQGEEEIATAYWFYVRNQSASLDWDIILRTLRSRPR